MAPNEVRGRTKVKVVYVVLEAQYQASISAGAALRSLHVQGDPDVAPRSGLLDGASKLWL